MSIELNKKEMIQWISDRIRCKNNEMSKREIREKWWFYIKTRLHLIKQYSE